MPLRFCCCAELRVFVGFFGFEDVYSNWAAARVDLVAFSRPIALVFIEYGQLFEHAGRRWRRTGADLFNDGVSIEGVSHVIAWGRAGCLLCNQAGPSAASWDYWLLYV